MALVAAVIVRDAAWRRWYVIVSAIGLGLLTFLAVEVLANHSRLAKARAVLRRRRPAAGHRPRGWYREQDRHNDMVSLSLLLGGSLLAGALAIAAIHDRWTGRFEGFLLLQRVWLLAVGVLLLVTGVLFQLRATTLCADAHSLYFLSLLIFVPWGRLNAVAVALMT